MPLVLGDDPVIPLTNQKLIVSTNSVATGTDVEVVIDRKSIEIGA